MSFKNVDSSNRVVPHLVTFDLGSFPTITLHEHKGYSKVTFEHLQFPGVDEDEELSFTEEQLNFHLVLKAVFGDNYNDENVAVFDSVKSALYAGQIWKGEDGKTIDLVFGVADGTENRISLIPNPETAKWEVKGHPVSLMISDEKWMIDNKPTDVKVPYVSFEKIVEHENVRYNVIFKLPFRSEKIIPPTGNIQDSWANGEVDTLATLLKKAPKGGGGWASLSSISQSFAMIGMPVLPKIELPIVGWEIITGGEYGDQMDIELAEGWQIPVLISKPSKNNPKPFISREVSKIRVNHNSVAFQNLKGFDAKPEAFKKQLFAKGLKLVIFSYNQRDKSFIPNHSIALGKPDVMTQFPKFDEMLGLAAPSTPEQPMLSDTASNTTVDVAATTVNDRNSGVDEFAVNPVVLQDAIKDVKASYETASANSSVF